MLSKDKLPIASPAHSFNHAISHIIVLALFNCHIVHSTIKLIHRIFLIYISLCILVIKRVNNIHLLIEFVVAVGVILSPFSFGLV